MIRGSFYQILKLSDYYIDYTFYFQNAQFPKEIWAVVKRLLKKIQEEISNG